MIGSLLKLSFVIAFAVYIADTAGPWVEKVENKAVKQVTEPVTSEAKTLQTEKNTGEVKKSSETTRLSFTQRVSQNSEQHNTQHGKRVSYIKGYTN